MSDEISVTQALNLLRRQRHSFLNHLQVIYGWLQLDRPERARAYLDAVASGMAAESDALRQAAAPLGLLMLELGLEAETHGLRLEWRLSGANAALPDAQQAELRRQVQAAMAQAAAGAVVVDLSADGFSVHTPSGKGEG
ncbi:MAG TPA: Spo0B domain-containing protein [Symbiobacteriaceae bacterium]|nr:Spo0B domain-containing protein [Symbiobacteriaceae bacterium]